MRQTRALVRRVLRGHRAAAAMQREILEARGAQPEQAIAECLDVLATLERQGLWPGPRDPVSERDVQRVRALWARVERATKRSRRR